MLAPAHAKTGRVAIKSLRDQYFDLIVTGVLVPHADGLEVNRRTYSFSDAHVDQHRLFAEDNDAYYAELMWREFIDRAVPYEQVRMWALNETPFLNAKSMLRVLEGEQRVIPEMIAGVNRKRGDFSEEKIAALRFGRFGPEVMQPELF